MYIFLQHCVILYTGKLHIHNSVSLKTNFIVEFSDVDTAGLKPRGAVWREASALPLKLMTNSWPNKQEAKINYLKLP